MRKAIPAVVEFVDEALVAPLTRIDLATNGQVGSFDGGVYQADGATVVELGLQIKHEYRNEPVVPLPHADATRVPGVHLFGGMLQTAHFGHFIIESLGRLWAASRIARVDSVVFYPRQPGSPAPGYAREMLELLGIEAQLRLVHAPTRFQTLVVPATMAQSGYFGGSPAARQLVAPLREVGRGTRAPKLYVSRSRLNPCDGAILLEERIEENLRREGYTVIHPEQLSLAEQLAHYNSAEHLVFADGSALHLYALVARPQQRVFVVWRRKSVGMFCWQIRSFGGSEPLGKPCVRELWVPEVAFGGMAQTKAVLDFEDLRAQLVAGGFIGGDGWLLPDEAEFAEALSAVKEKTGRSFTLQQPA